jgi:cob(I)alamin adenosyltransferase
MTKIYTKTGDKGRTGTMRGRVAKSDTLVEALGAIDELNSWVGYCRYQIQSSNDKFTIEVQNELKRIQNNLLVIGSGLAGSGLKLSSREIKRLERVIDRLTEELPKLRNFIYPVGQLQVARAVCRRAERAVVGFMNKSVLKYLNRLSDALFVMARWVNYKTEVPEEVWRG